MIKELAEQCSVSAVCDILNVSRSFYYYQPVTKCPGTKLEDQIEDIFRRSHKNYGTRKIKHELAKCGIKVSRRKIGQIMRQKHLVSNYQKAKYRHHEKSYNQASTPNLLNRQFNQTCAFNVVASDLTYVRVGHRWCYICLIVDLWNREIIGWSVSARKDAELVRQAFYSIPYRLDKIEVFHTDRGKEFDNQLIAMVLAAFGIKQSLSNKGCPYDNAVIESINHVLKTEFIYQHHFFSLNELRRKLSSYIHWYNYERIHGSLHYQTPMNLRYLKTNIAITTSPLDDCCKKG